MHKQELTPSFSQERKNTHIHLSRKDRQIARPTTHTITLNTTGHLNVIPLLQRRWRNVDSLFIDHIQRHTERKRTHTHTEIHRETHTHYNIHTIRTHRFSNVDMC